MLADQFPKPPTAGSVATGLIPLGASRRAVLDFIADQLPRWRDRPERKTETAETVLTEQLCRHLNSACYWSSGFDVLQFRTEERDEVQHRRKSDLTVAPRGHSLLVEGRSYTDFDTIVPVECKRLPTPKKKNRSEREYVISDAGSVDGGIQRFKFGAHASAHTLAGMIAYVQSDSSNEWECRVQGWIEDLAVTSKDWTSADRLHSLSDDPATKIRTLRSIHRRTGNLPDIELRHMWVIM